MGARSPQLRADKRQSPRARDMPRAKESFEGLSLCLLLKDFIPPEAAAAVSWLLQQTGSEAVHVPVGYIL